MHYRKGMLGCSYIQGCQRAFAAWYWANRGRLLFCSSRNSLVFVDCRMYLQYSFLTLALSPLTFENTTEKNSRHSNFGVRLLALRPVKSTKTAYFHFQTSTNLAYFSWRSHLSCPIWKHFGWAGRDWAAEEGLRRERAGLTRRSVCTK